jgi:hypothetical protein
VLPSSPSKAGWHYYAACLGRAGQKVIQMAARKLPNTFVLPAYWDQLGLSRAKRHRQAYQVAGRDVCRQGQSDQKEEHPHAVELSQQNLPCGSMAIVALPCPSPAESTEFSSLYMDQRVRSNL